jgi:hypothetical protein
MHPSGMMCANRFLEWSVDGAEAAAWVLFAPVIFSVERYLSFSPKISWAMRKAELAAGTPQ